MNHLVEHPAAHEDTPDLIAHILERYHEAHRQELPELVTLAEKVEAVHATDPRAPHGLAEALKAMVATLEAHMEKEETVLFPAMQQGGGDSIRRPIAVMRHDHAEHEQALARIAAATHGFNLPKGACRSWTRLYAGVRKLVEDLDEHMHLENDVLFPRFEAAPEHPEARH